jgi:hypothetical protein
MPDEELLDADLRNARNACIIFVSKGLPMMSSFHPFGGGQGTPNSFNWLAL